MRMPRSCTSETPPLALASSTTSLKPALSSKSSTPRPVAVRKSVPTLSSKPLEFPSRSTDAPGQLITITSASSSPPPRQRPHTSGSSSGPLDKRTISSPTSLLPPFGLTSRPLPPAPAGQSAASPAMTTLSSSLSRNSSVPASLTHTVYSSNIPTRSHSASVGRPSLSSPSPPTPVVPSIPLRHATQYQRSTTRSIDASAPSTDNTPPAPPASRSRESFDPHPSSKKHPDEFPPGITPQATASDPNLPSPRLPAPVAPPDSSHWALTLKQLLAKPAIPINLNSSSESESGKATNFSQAELARHRRSASTLDHPPRTTDSNLEQQTSRLDMLEMSGSRQAQATSFKGTSDARAHYHDSTSRRRMAGTVSQSWTQNKGGQGGWIPHDVEQSILWPEWKGDEEKRERKATREKERITEGEKEKGKEQRVRNVLRRRPSAGSRVSGPRPRGSTSPTISRTPSMTSLLKHGSLFTPTRSPSAHPVSPLPKPSPQFESFPADPPGGRSPVAYDKISDQGAISTNARPPHVSRASAALPHTASGVGTSRNVPSSSSTGSSVAARVPTQTLPTASPPAPAPAYSRKLRDSTGMQSSSAASSSSSVSRRRHSKEKILSPAGAVADAYKRGQLAKELSPISPSRPRSPDLPSIVIDTDDIRGPHDMPANTNQNSNSRPESKTSNRSGLSYAEPKSEVGAAGVVEQVLSVPRMGAKHSPRSPYAPSLEAMEFAAHDSLKGYKYLLDSSSSSKPSPSSYHPPLPTTHPPPPLIASPPPRISSSKEYPRHRPKTIQPSYDDKDDAAYTPYYTVFGAPTDQVLAVGGPRDSYGASYSPLDQSLWGVQTTITVGKASEGEGERPSLRRSLSRKLSGKFRRERSTGAIEEGLSGRRGRSGWQDGQGLPMSPRTSFSKMLPEEEDDHCLPPPRSPKKHAAKELSAGTKEKSGGRFKFWRFMGGSKERNEGVKMDDRPPLPTLPKHYHPHNTSQPNDIYTPIYSRRRHSRDGSPLKKNPRSQKSNAHKTSYPSARPSTAPSSSPMSFDATAKFWNRTQSARSSISSDDPSAPGPRHMPAKIASMEDTVTQGPKPGIPTSKLNNAWRPQKAHVDIEGEPYKLTTDTERSDSPPIPLFSNTDVINSFPPRGSSDRSKNSPTSPSSANATPAVTSPPPRPRRSSQRPAPHSRPNSFGDEPLYPPVMNQAAKSDMPKITFRAIHSPKRVALTEQEKADRWDALLEKSEAAGGTLHFGGDDDKLLSDDLRFSRTLSELARDDE